MLLSLRTAARTHLPSTLPLRRSSAAALTRKPSIVSYFRSNIRSYPSSIRMSSSDSQSNPSSNQIIEHIVLFKVKPDADPSAVDAMIANLNGLISLESVIHLATGPVSRCRSNSLAFTHMLHSRYRSKADLVTYTNHPEHVSVVSNNVKPIVEDVMAVDWVADHFSGPAIVSPGSAVRLTILKTKEGAGESGKNEVLKVLSGIKEKFPSIEQLSVGDNFSPGRAKGFSICSIAVFKGMKELEELDAETEAANEQKDKVREFLDGVLVLDYTVPAYAQKTANL
ncbi:hypothetical protein CASFOL_030759 [Castilleja foliolosa]|uniref:Stress-response A/B barrel domain-containing protein n=1 Tax=Castilleja foliolosa TaxID=1961234 RepID=A0ABD3C680_9LAMI